MSLARDIQVAELSFVVTGNPARKRRGLRSRLVGQRKRDCTDCARASRAIRDLFRAIIRFDAHMPGGIRFM
ncbi:hypothetical protein ASD52_30395 [Ensifer sp. Root142]|nr:hypothetical protein ASD52_30395 [Ensifer sp. Root142]